MEKAALERYLADGLSLEAIGRRAGRAASTIGYWVSKHGLVAVHQERRVSRGGITRQRLEELVEAGIFKPRDSGSARAQRHHSALLARPSRLSDAACGTPSPEAEDHGSPPSVVESTCPRHGKGKFRLEARDTYRCLRCRADAVTRRRRVVLLCSNCHGEVEAGLHQLERLSELRGWDSNPQPLG